MSVYSQSMHTQSTHRHDIGTCTDSHGNRRQTRGVLTQTQALPEASSRSPLAEQGRDLLVRIYRYSYIRADVTQVRSAECLQWLAPGSLMQLADGHTGPPVHDLTLVHTRARQWTALTLEKS